MNPQQVEILLVEDSPTDAELTVRALKKSNLAQHPENFTSCQVEFENFDQAVCNLGFYGLFVNQPPCTS